MKYFTSYVYSLCFYEQLKLKIKQNHFEIEIQNIRKLQIVLQSYNQKHCNSTSTKQLLIHFEMIASFTQFGNFFL